MQFYHSNLLSSVTSVTHAFTTKQNGNLAFHVNDDPLTVHQNHENLAKFLHYTKKSLIHMKQIHSSYVHIVNDKDSFDNPKECDALVTNKKNTPLMVMVADCSPILFYDSMQAVIAVAHAGRQGAFKNIIKNTLNTMQDSFGCNMKDVLVSIGPSISKCCYKVGSEIYDKTLKIGLSYAIESRDNSYYLDISSILKKQLLESSIQEKNIEISKECTCCENHKYNSYRADSTTGRFCGIISLL